MAIPRKRPAGGAGCGPHPKPGKQTAALLTGAFVHRKGMNEWYRGVWPAMELATLGRTQMNNPLFV
jgi:hypothetical protein